MRMMCQAAGYVDKSRLSLVGSGSFLRGFGATGDRGCVGHALSGGHCDVQSDSATQNEELQKA